MEKTIINLARNLANDFIEFVNRAVSPFHVTHESKLLLVNSGFKELSEQDNWALENGGKYFFTRNRSTIVAFTVGTKFDPNNTGFKIIGAHTDSPTLRLAPLSKLKQEDYIQTHVCTYGGGLWHTWFDRDLTLAGRVIYRDQTGKYDSTLFHYKNPLLKIPNLAIHLTSAEDRGKFAPNSEQHLRPIIAHEVYNQLAGIKYEDAVEGSFQRGHHYEGLLQLIARETNLSANDIVDLDLYFLDAQPSGFFGLNNEYISSARLDNLFSSYFALRALVDADSEFANSSFVNMVTLFDHEEVGSQSFQGADSSLLRQTIERIFGVLSAGHQVKADSLQKLFHNSFQLSADMAHALHPNYSDKHKVGYRPAMNKGVVVKINHNQRYSTDAVSSAVLKALAERGKVELQEFIVKNDSPCGTTIGPITASLSGIKSVDIGCPQLGMHSIRETCGVVDALHYLRLFTTFYREFEQLNHALFKL